MATEMKIVNDQRGGSTLIGLVLGLCLGMLALLKWPQLESPVRALLAQHDISLSATPENALSTVDGRTSQVSSASNPTVHSASLQSSSSTVATIVEQTKLGGGTGVNGGAIDDTRPQFDTTPHPSADPLHRVESANRAVTPNPRAAGGAAKTRLLEKNSDQWDADLGIVSQVASSLSGSAVESPVPLTREVWQAFSSESAAEAFANAVSTALGIELATLRQSDHKVVPIVRCEAQAKCDAVHAQIAAYLAGTDDTEILR